MNIKVLHSSLLAASAIWVVSGSVAWAQDAQKNEVLTQVAAPNEAEQSASNTAATIQLAQADTRATPLL